jgi:predicted nucleic acid-binding Zn ribbon protein
MYEVRPYSRNAFDATQRPTCEGCGEFMIKSYTPPAVQFKGGGWGGQG